MVKEIVRSFPLEEISAGYFEDRPWLDRINPLTPTHSKRFVPSPEAQLILDDFSKKHNKQVNVLPLPEKRIPPEDIKGVLGAYFPYDLRGGPLDPFTRNIYMNKDENLAGAWTLAHELGHAQDPSMKYFPLKRLAGTFHNLTGNLFNKPDISWMSGNYPTQGELHQHNSKYPLQTFKDEIDAQVYAREAYKKPGVSDETSRGDLFGYPGSYIEKLHKQFEQPYPAEWDYKTGIDYGTTDNFDFTAENRNRLLNRAFEIGADKEYQESKKNLINKALDYARQFNMKPAENVFSQLNWSIE